MIELIIAGLAIVFVGGFFLGWRRGHAQATELWSGAVKTITDDIADLARDMDEWNREHPDPHAKESSS